MATKSRPDLKAYFVKNAIPTEGNFADLIDATLNQSDDGVFKTAGEPLSVVAATNTQRRVLRLFADYPSTTPDWILSLRPAQNPSDDKTIRTGFGITDGTGTPRLFIDSATGNLGVGTNDPKDRGHFSGGSLRVSSNAGTLRLEGSDHSYIEYYPSGYSSGRKAWIGFGNAGTPTLTVRNEADIILSGTRITATANLDVSGTLSATAGLKIGTSDLASGNIAQVQGGALHLDGNALYLRTGVTDKFDFVRWGSSGDVVEVGGYNGVTLGNTSGGYAAKLSVKGDRVEVATALVAKTTLAIGSSSTTTYPLDVTTSGISGWSRFVVTAEGFWGDANTTHVTIGAGGSSGIMLSNPHVPWYAGDSRASIRYGRTGGAAGKTWWDAGVRSDGAFSWSASEDGAVGETLRMEKTGQITAKYGLKVTGVLSGAPNDYVKAQFALSGGGTVTWGGPSGYLKWTSRFIAISMERSSTFSSGYVNITLPTAASQITAYDGTNRFDATQGIQLKDWEALYAVHTLGGSPDQVSYQIVSYTTGTITAPSNWILVAVLNNDDQTIKLGTGVSIPKSGTYAASYGSGVPKGAILMWSGTTAPTGWSLCDGTNGTPDLRGRFVLGSGTGSGLTARTVGGTGGEEKHTLTTAELPAHNHAVSDPGHSHYWSATRQLAGTDDNNNTSELSKGDRSTQDVPTFYTNSTTTGISISNTGSGSSHENMPPFYVLAFIMKL